MIIIFWSGISQMFLRSSIIINDAWDLQNVWCKSIIRCQRSFSGLIKSLDRVWHDGLMYTLKSFGICVSYCGLLHSLLSDRHQKEVFNGQSSNWSHIKAGALQGSIRGMLLPEGVATSAKLFADDTSLFLVVHNSAASSASVNADLQNISRWAYQRKMIFNPDALK